MKAPEPDPEVARQRKIAEREKADSMKQDLSTQTRDALRFYGARQAMSGSYSAKGPRIGGGFLNLSKM